MCNDTFLGSYHTKMKTSAPTCIGNNGITKKTILNNSCEDCTTCCTSTYLARLLIVKFPTFN